MSGDIELKACPHCGGKANNAHLAGSAWFIDADHASDCHLADFHRTEAEAIAAWNRRALSPPLELKGERVAIARIIQSHFYRSYPDGSDGAIEAADAILSRLVTAYSTDTAAAGPSDGAAGSAERKSEESAAWAWLTGQPGLELSYGFYDEEEEGEWQVHRVSGGRNDREWTLVGNGQTASAAVLVARINLSSGEPPVSPAGGRAGNIPPDEPLSGNAPPICLGDLASGADRASEGLRPFASDSARQSDWVLVPRIARAKQVADAIMRATVEAPTPADYTVAAAALEFLPPTGHPLGKTVLAELVRDYRAMIEGCAS